MIMKKQKVYAFIDSQNLSLGTSKDLLDREGHLVYQGWKLDYRKFRVYLRDKFGVEKAILFIGYMDKYKPLYKAIRQYGYDLVFKPTVQDELGKPKGNIDAELVLHTAAIEYPNFELAVVVSGDGDFYCLYEFLEQRQKLGKIIIPNRRAESSLLKRFQEYKIFLIREREKIEYRAEEKKIGRRSALSPDKRSFLPRDSISLTKKREKSR